MEEIEEACAKLCFVNFISDKKKKKKKIKYVRYKKVITGRDCPARPHTMNAILLIYAACVHLL
jgi:Ni,Fe-hydrogenase I small subunit